MKKLKLYFWILLLFVLSVPAGFLTILIEKPYTPKSEYLFILIGGTIAVSIVVGSLSLIPFFVLRKRNKDLALKRALQCYTFFAVALIGVASFKYPEAMKERDRYHFSLYYEPLFEKILLEEIEEKKNQLPASVLEHKEEISTCILFEIQFNDRLIDKLRTENDPEAFFVNDPKIRQIKKDCIDLYK
nr:hypothetical protein [uncultured Fluviicola sp.]